jgi:hypothetical protein
MMIDEDDLADEVESSDLYCEECSELMDRQDHAGLIRCCRQRWERHPDDPCAVADVADAHVRAGQFEQAIAFVRPYYDADPDNFDFQASILESLAGLGKSWDEFPWTSRPPIIRMSGGVLDECHRFLRPKRKPRSVFEVYEQFLPRGHLLFSEEDLLRQVRADERLVVTEGASVTQVSVRRRR